MTHKEIYDPEKYDLRDSRWEFLSVQEGELTVRVDDVNILSGEGQGQVIFFSKFSGRVHGAGLDGHRLQLRCLPGCRQHPVHHKVSADDTEFYHRIASFLAFIS